MKNLLRVLSAVIPFVIIGGLLYAGIFVKPKSVGASVMPPVLTQRDAFYGVAIPADNIIWAAGRNGKIVRSEDAGKTWMIQPTPVRANLQSIAAWDVSRAIAVGNSGAVLTTTDGGKTWTTVANVPRNNDMQKYIRVRVAADGSAWMVGEFGLILASKDFGSTWKSLGRQEDVAWNDVAVGASSLLLVGEFGKMRRSTDGGANWKDVVSPLKSSLLAVAAGTDGIAVAVGLEGAILVSRDDGATWQRVESGTNEHLFCVSRNGENWVAVGNQGLYLTAGSDAQSWTLKHFAERVFAWHSDVQTRAGTIFVAGATLSQVTPDGKFLQFK
ncbi:MAG: YCF48-related protein [Sterolibacterium sp.]